MMEVAKGNQQTVNEKQLFHGTSTDAVEAICKQNFDWRLHGKNATKYGEGSYFAVNASYSHTYAKKSSSSDMFMFVAKVLVGFYITGNSSYRRPPSKNPSDPASDLYDSCVDNQVRPTIFVVFDTDQFYPEYIIQYDSTVSHTTYASGSALPQPGNLKRPPVRARPGAKPNDTSAYYAPQPPTTVPSRPNLSSSQPLKGILKHPASSNVSVTSSLNVTDTPSSYSLSTTRPSQRPRYVAQRPTHVAPAANSSVSVTSSPNVTGAGNSYSLNTTSSSQRPRHVAQRPTHVAPAANSSVSVTSSTNVTGAGNSYSLSTTSSSQRPRHVAQRPTHVATAVNSSVPFSGSSKYSTVSTNNSLSTSSRLDTSYTASSSSASNFYHTVASSSHITPTRHVGSSLQSVGRASASDSSFSTPFNSKSSVTFPTPKKKKDCLIM